MNRLITALAVGGLLLTAGCSSDKASSQPAPLNGLQSYASIKHMTSELADGGFTCDRTESRDTFKYAAESIACYHDGREYTLALHLSDADRDSAISVNETLLGSAGISYGLVAGANWTVNCGDPDRCQPIKQILGGKVTAKAGQ